LGGTARVADWYDSCGEKRVSTTAEPERGLRDTAADAARMASISVTPAGRRRTAMSFVFRMRGTFAVAAAQHQRQASDTSAAGACVLRCAAAISSAAVMLYLASQSPRRRQLLEQVGIRFDTVDVDVPEVRAPGEPPADYVSRVAREKAGAGLLTLTGVPGAVVLGADTEVVLGDEVFGKPGDAMHAVAMLRRLSGRTHLAISAVWCVSAGREERATSVSEVVFAPLSERAILDYVASGEPLGRAGAYAIQGRAAAFIARLSGSYSGVMGLPLFETLELLSRFGIGADE
jgi:septum formation protein